MAELTTNRPFSDLIAEIEFEGEKFIPATKIASLAFNYNEKAVTKNAKFWENKGYDGNVWYVFEPSFLLEKKHKCTLGISCNYDISIYHRFDDEPNSNVGNPAYNQVDIFRKLVEWGFISN